MGDDRHVQTRLIVAKFRRSLAEQNEQDGAVSLTQVCQEVDPGGKSTQYDLRTKGNTARSGVENEPLQDPLIYPGVYAPSGFDMMGILVCCVYFCVFLLPLTTI